MNVAFEIGVPRISEPLIETTGTHCPVPSFRQHAPLPIEAAVALAGEPKPNSWRLFAWCVLGLTRERNTRPVLEMNGKKRCDVCIAPVVVVVVLFALKVMTPFACAIVIVVVVWIHLFVSTAEPSTES